MRSILIGWLLNSVYLLALVLALPWLIWSAVFHGKYREGYGQKLLGRVPVRAGRRPCIWLHAVSVGEVNVLRTLVAEFERRRPDVELTISTTTKTGFDLARQRFGSHSVFYCPLDFTWATAAAVRRIRPDLVLLAELELWPNLIASARRQGAAVAIVNGRLSDQSFRGYCRGHHLVKGVLQQLCFVAAQDETTAARFHQLGVPSQRLHVTGSLKYDGAQTDRHNLATDRLRELAAISPGEIVFIAGSTQTPEEELAIVTYRSLAEEFPQLRLILVPRHPQRFASVADLLDSSGMPWVRRTALDKAAGHAPRGTSSLGGFTPSDSAKTKEFRPIILVDTVGELGAWWGIADIAFVGGSLGSRGGQNMIEPAAYGAAVCFGPNTRSFRDIVRTMLREDAAHIVNNGPELARFVRRCLTDRPWAEELGGRARRLVISQLGATERTATLLEPILPPYVARHDASLPAA